MTLFGPRWHWTWKRNVNTNSSIIVSSFLVNFFIYIYFLLYLIFVRGEIKLIKKLIRHLGSLFIVEKLVKLFKNRKTSKWKSLFHRDTWVEKEEWHLLTVWLNVICLLKNEICLFPCQFPLPSQSETEHRPDRYDQLLIQSIHRLFYHFNISYFLRFPCSNLNSEIDFIT